MQKTILHIVMSLLSWAAISSCQSANISMKEASSEANDLRFNAAPVDELLANLVKSGDVVGVSALVYANGQEVYFGAQGLADREAKRPWTRGSLANIYSMTKPVTGVVLMTLYEDGLFKLDDPLHKYLPEYKDIKVFAGMDDNGEMILDEPVRPITIKDIMRHTAGFSYGWGGSPVDQAVRHANLLDPSKSLAQFSRELSGIPLSYQPGTQWRYSVAVDVQARLAEVLSGQPYEDLVHTRVLDPLGMTETGYFVPPADKDKVTAVYIRGEDGALTREPDSQVYGFWTEKPAQINGGHGLVSSVDDYMRFARMLLGGGSFGGVQILGPETIAFMTQDHLPDGLTELDFLPGKGRVGFGLDFAVRTAPPVDDLENAGVVGEFFWDGRASTLFWVDPKNNLAAVFFVQVVPFDGTLHHRFRRAVYTALEVSPAE